MYSFQVQTTAQFETDMVIKCNCQEFVYGSSGLLLKKNIHFPHSHITQSIFHVSGRTITAKSLAYIYH